MNHAPLLILLTLTAATTGCIAFDGEERITVQLLITEDMGTMTLSQTNVTLPEGSTVLDALRHAHTVDTAYGGGFVETIDGKTSQHPNQHIDWFYHVDTRLSPIGAADYELDDEQLILWDYRPWNHTMTIPHILTGLDAWPNDLPENLTLTPDAWHENTTTPHKAQHIFAHTDDEQLILHDAWNTPTLHLDPPWLIVHAAQSATDEPHMLVHASSPQATTLADALHEEPPRGLGIAITPNGTHTVPAP